jgi:hypothetical protein
MPDSALALFKGLKGYIAKSADPENMIVVVFGNGSGSGSSEMR